MLLEPPPPNQPTLSSGVRAGRGEFWFLRRVRAVRKGPAGLGAAAERCSGLGSESAVVAAPAQRDIQHYCTQKSRILPLIRFSKISNLSGYLR